MLKLLGSYALARLLGFGLFGAIVISITGWIASGFIGDQGKVEVIKIERL